MVEAIVPQFLLEINGSPSSSDLRNDILEAIVENSLTLPDLCTLRIHDAGFKWIDHPSFVEGAPIRIEGSYGRHQMETLFDGEIVGVELDLAAFGSPTLTVQCLDRSHRLHRGRQSRSFTNLTDEDVVKKVAAEHGFKVKSDSTPTVHEWIFQNNQTNWEFLTMLAGRNGFRLTLHGERDLHFRKVDDAESQQLVEVEWGKELRSFRPRTNASTQVDEVEVRSWDPHTKSPISASAKAPKGTPKTGIGDGGRNAKKAFGKAKLVVVDYPVHSNEEAADVARSICDEIGGSYLEAEGMLYGMPHLKAGMAIKVKNIGKRFGGVYFLTTTQHTYTPTEGFSTLFTVTGKKSSSLLSLIDKQNLADRKPLGSSLVVGIVTDNKDPSGLNRVKVMYPWLTEDHTSFWARQSSQMAGKGRGMFNIPEIGDEVLVAFEHGDVNRPFILGQLWNGKDKPPSPSGNPTHGPGSVTNRRGLYSRVGHMVDIDDTGGGGVKLTTSGGVKVHCTDDGPTILCSTPGGQSITITDAGSLIKIQDNAGDVITLSNGVINATASTMMNLSAPMININGAISVTINGMAISIDAGAMAAINSGALTSVVSGNAVYVGAGASLRAEAGGKAEVQGKAGLELDGTTVVEVKAAQVKLN